MISLFLMSKKGKSVLENIVLSGLHNTIDKVISSRDSSVEKDYYDDIKRICEKENITFYNRKDDYSISSQYAIVISWRWLINLNKTKIIILHDSLLPKYRGFNPLVSCLLNRETQIGVTAFYATRDFDAGPIDRDWETKNHEE